jgi:phage-related tail protein
MKDDRGELDMSKQIEELQQRVKDLESINEGHRQLNAELRVELQMWKDMSSEHEKTKNLLHGYKKVIEDLSSQLRKAGK